MADTFVKNPVLLVGEKDEVVAQMGENDLGVATDVEFYTKQEVDDLVAQRGGASLPILLSVLSDHLLNDISWLRADTFSWQSGDVYVAAYNHLADDVNAGINRVEWRTDGTVNICYTRNINPQVGDSVYSDTSLTTEIGVVEATGSGITVSNNKVYHFYAVHSSGTSTTETIAGVQIGYFLASDGHKICLSTQESNLVALYEATGAADYYILDANNNQFKLPRKQKRTLIQAVKNTDGTWYKLYSDGWVEQGGYDSTNFNNRSWTYPIAMSDRNYTLTLSVGYVNIDTQNGKFGITSRTETGFSYKVISLGGNAVGDNMSWRVEGYSAVQGGGVQRKYEYYYVGKFEQSAIEQTAGLNAEMFNDLNAHKVIEFQAPAADNGYTWYRKYADGWVEQGGVLSATTTSVTLPVEMIDDNYPVQIFYVKTAATSNVTFQRISTETQTTTGFTSPSASSDRRWQVSGMSAQ